MNLDDYQWSRNPRGMHNEGVYRFRLDRYQEVKSGWVKLVSADTEFVGDIQGLLAANMTPIVRTYRAQWCGRPADAAVYAEVEAYINAGVRWFELWNEPNLGLEWPPHLEPGLDPTNIGTYIGPLMDYWVAWAERIINMGGYPAFPALSESIAFPHTTTIWLRNMMSYLHDVHNQTFQRILGNGLWLATHPYIFNHYHQEIPGGGPLSARQPHMLNAAEGGWHFEYPYDPITQTDDPGRTVWGGTPKTPDGDPNGLTAVGIAFMEQLRDVFGGGIVPVIGTEGGIWPWPGPGDGTRIDDSRFPGYTWESHAETTAAVFDWISSEAAPPWLFGLTLWKEEYYWETAHGTAPTVQKLAATSTAQKYVPSLDTGGTIWNLPVEPPVVIPVEVEPEGPGPVHGSADFHFIILAPDFDTSWFFQTAEHYWLRYQPTLLNTPDIIPLVPYAQSLAVTVITTPEQVDLMNREIRDEWPTIWYDLVVVTSANELLELFNQRLSSGRRFG